MDFMNTMVEVIDYIEEHITEDIDFNDVAKIVSECLPSSGYEKSMNYELEVYGPGDTGSDEYICEIWIPIKKK